MANRYWVGGTGTWNNTTTNWSTTSGGAPGASSPGSADDVIFDNNSGSSGMVVTVNVMVSSGTPRTVNSITFNNTSRTMTLALYNPLTYNSTTMYITRSWINNSGSNLSVIQSPLNDPNWSAGIQFYSAISGSTGLLKSGGIPSISISLTVAAGLAVPPTWTLLDDWPYSGIYCQAGVVLNMDTYSTGYAASAPFLPYVAHYGQINNNSATASITCGDYDSTTTTTIGGTYNRLNIVVKSNGYSSLFPPLNCSRRINWTLKGDGTNIRLLSRTSSSPLTFTFTKASLDNFIIDPTFTGTILTSSSSGSTYDIDVYGNLTFSASGTYNSNTFVFREGGTSVPHVLTTNNATLGAVTISVGSYTNNFDANTSLRLTGNIDNSLNRLEIRSGWFYTDNYNLKVGSFFATSADQNKYIYFGTSTITIDGTFDVSLNSTGAINTRVNLDPGTSTIVVGSSNNSARTIKGGGKQLYNLVIGNNPTATNYAVNFFGGNSCIGTISSVMTTAFSIFLQARGTGQIPPDSYLSVTNWTISGTAGNLVTIGRFGGTGLERGYIQIGTIPTTLNYLSVSNMNGIAFNTPTNFIYVGYQSVDGGNNSGWSFTSYSNSSGILAFF